MTIGRGGALFWNTEATPGTSGSIPFFITDVQLTAGKGPIDELRHSRGTVP